MCVFGMQIKSSIYIRDVDLSMKEVKERNHVLVKETMYYKLDFLF